MNNLWKEDLNSAGLSLDKEACNPRNHCSLLVCEVPSVKLSDAPAQPSQNRCLCKGPKLTYIRSVTTPPKLANSLLSSSSARWLKHPFCQIWALSVNLGVRLPSTHPYTHSVPFTGVTEHQQVQMGQKGMSPGRLAWSSRLLLRHLTALSSQLFLCLGRYKTSRDWATGFLPRDSPASKLTSALSSPYKAQGTFI